MLLSTTSVYANDIYYYNSHGVNFTVDEYSFISDMFYEGYQDVMNEADYEEIFYDNDIVDSEITTDTYSDFWGIVPYGTSLASPSKRLTISKACTSSCLITIKADWTASPRVRSYDVIGAYLDNVDRLTFPTTKVSNSTGSNSSMNIKEDENGFGVSIELLSSGADMKVTQYFRVTSGGTVYGSYQHATSNISLADSKKYTISRSGYGGVFLFDSSIRSYYDAMGGVSIIV